MSNAVPEVYKAIVAVAADIAKTGIGKNRKNDQQGYKFRGIDDVYNEMAPLLAKHDLCILPRILHRECVERTNAKGTALFYVFVEAEFQFVSAKDGSSHSVVTFGEAMDSADKATNKAMSAAYKYAAFQAFCIPTEGDNDADATTHEVMPPKPAIKLDAAILDKITLVESMQQLNDLWKSIDVAKRSAYKDIFGDAKKHLQEALNAPVA